MGSVQGKSPYEVDINEGLAVGRVEGRTGVHVECSSVKETTTRARATCCARYEE